MVQGMVQARQWTGNGVGSGPMSVELQQWLRHIDKAWGIAGRSAGTWLEGGMALEAGDSARRAWWMGSVVRWPCMYIEAAGADIQ
jgi:hypothetical protein